MKRAKMELILNGLTEKEKNALKEALSPIYFSDSADYIRGLWNVVQALIGDQVKHVTPREWLSLLEPDVFKEDEDEE